MKRVKYLCSFAIALLWIIIIGTISTLLIDINSSWYNSLILPSYMPKSIIFSLVWSIIYINFTIIISNIIVKYRLRKDLYFLVGTVTILNCIWILLFFIIHSIFISLFIILAQIALLVVLLYRLRKNTLTFILVFITLIWYNFTIILNYSIIVLN